MEDTRGAVCWGLSSEPPPPPRPGAYRGKVPSRTVTGASVKHRVPRPGAVLIVRETAKSSEMAA